MRLRRFQAALGRSEVVGVKSSNEQISRWLGGFMVHIHWLRYINDRTRGQSKVNAVMARSTTVFTFTHDEM